MNKKSILLILLSTLALGANAQGKYTIKGNLQNAEGQKIYLYSGGSFKFLQPFRMRALSKENRRGKGNHRCCHKIQKQ